MKSSKDAQRVGRKLFQATMAGGKLDTGIVRKVITTLSDKKPRGYIGMIDAYLRFVRLEADRHHARVESAAELSSEMQQTVTSDLRGKYGDQLTIEFSTNADLLGGMRVRVGSDVWDGSVKNRLDRLADAFG
jgi:F-type H+-transporting ATPase subunit delta